MCRIIGCLVCENISKRPPKNLKRKRMDELEDSSDESSDEQEDIPDNVASDFVKKCLEERPKVDIEGGSIVTEHTAINTTTTSSNAATSRGGRGGGRGGRGGGRGSRAGGTVGGRRKVK